MDRNDECLIIRSSIQCHHFEIAGELQEASAFSVVSTRLNYELLWKEDLFRLLSPTNERALVELRPTRLVLVLIFSTGIQS